MVLAAAFPVRWQRPACSNSVFHIDRQREGRRRAVQTLSSFAGISTTRRGRVHEIRVVSSAPTSFRATPPSRMSLRHRPGGYRRRHCHTGFGTVAAVQDVVAGTTYRLSPAATAEQAVIAVSRTGCRAAPPMSVSCRPRVQGVGALPP